MAAVPNDQVPARNGRAGPRTTAAADTDENGDSPSPIRFAMSTPDRPGRAVRTSASPCTYPSTDRPGDLGLHAVEDRNGVDVIDRRGGDQ